MAVWISSFAFAASEGVLAMAVSISTPRPSVDGTANPEPVYKIVNS
jgi:hypothetical protein